MDPLQDHEAIQQFVKLLEENGRQEQAAELSQLLQYMESMNRQFAAVVQELQEIKVQLAQEQQPAVEHTMQGTAANLENTAEWARDVLAGLWERLADRARNAVENFKAVGVPALDRAVSAVGVKNVLEIVQNHLSSMIADTKQTIEKVENIGHELRSAGGHLKNAGRAMLGRETQAVDGGQEGRFQSGVLAPMRVVQALLSGMNNATLAAIGGVEHLEQTAEDMRVARAEKKPSIRRALAEKKEEAARSAVTLEKVHKPQEAAL